MDALTTAKHIYTLARANGLKINPAVIIIQMCLSPTVFCKLRFC